MKQYIKYKNGIAMVEARYYNYNIQKKNTIKQSHTVLCYDPLLN